MKNFSKLFVIAALAAAIVFSAAGCQLNDADYEGLNGDWDRGDIVVTFSNNTATFTQIDSDSGWQQVLDNGGIHLGSQKFRNITKKGDLEWTGQELTYNTFTYTPADWVDCTLTISGQTLYISSSSGSNTYTRVE
jgi:hypothetical protein